MRTNRERQIEDAVIRRPDVLGYPDAAAIRNVRIAWRFGRVDVMLLPRDGLTKLVLVEAKYAAAPDAVSKVLGQLLMYYAGALTIGSVGLDCYRRYAGEHRSEALSHAWTSPKALTGGITPSPAAWAHIESGEKIRPEEVALIVALSAPPHDALRHAIRALNEHHRLHVGIAVADGTSLNLISPADQAPPREPPRRRTSRR